MDPSEELAYWYLRLNDFLLLQHFVTHRTGEEKYSYEIDLLGIRPPFVFEEIGGQDDDWDAALLQPDDFNRNIGVICEVKSGYYDVRKLFRPYELEYAVGRLGFVARDQISEVALALRDQPRIDVSEAFQIRTLLIAHGSKRPNCSCDFISIEHVRDFLRKRIGKYPKSKYQDRTLFGSILFQYMIEWN